MSTSISTRQKLQIFNTAKFKSGEDLIQKFAPAQLQYAGRDNKQKFATVVTTDYAGTARQEILTAIYGGAPTIDAGIFPLIASRPVDQGSKYIVKFPTIALTSSVVQTSSPSYGQASYTATSNHAQTYKDIELKEKHILEEINFSKWVPDYFQSLMPQGDLNDTLPANANDALMTLYMGAASEAVESDIFYALDAGFDAGTSGSGCAYYGTGTKADFLDSTKVRKALADAIIGFINSAAGKAKIKAEDLIVIVPKGIYAAFQFSAPVLVTDNLQGVSSGLADILGVYAIHTSWAMDANAIYIMTRDSVGLVTDGPDDYTNPSVTYLGDNDKKVKNIVQVGIFWRFGADFVKPCEAGRITLS